MTDKPKAWLTAVTDRHVHCASAVDRSIATTQAHQDRGFLLSELVKAKERDRTMQNAMAVHDDKIRELESEVQKLVAQCIDKDRVLIEIAKMAEGQAGTLEAVKARAARHRLISKMLGYGFTAGSKGGLACWRHVESGEEVYSDDALRLDAAGWQFGHAHSWRKRMFDRWYTTAEALATLKEKTKS